MVGLALLLIIPLCHSLSIEHLPPKELSPPLSTCDALACRVSEESLDSALVTFLCFTQQECRGLDEIGKKRQLAKKIAPHLLFKDFIRDQDLAEELARMDWHRLVRLVNLVLHDRYSDVVERKTEDEYLDALIDGLVKRTNQKVDLYIGANPILLGMLNCYSKVIRQKAQLPELSSPIFDKDGSEARLPKLFGLGKHKALQKLFGLGKYKAKASPATNVAPCYGDKEWSYHGESGPQAWGCISPKCFGSLQSPINLNRTSAEEKSLSPIEFLNYNMPSNKTKVENNGHSLMVTFTAQSTASMSGGPLPASYEFLQLHFHWGSEHTVDGEQFDLEMHMVHKSSDLAGKDPMEVKDGLAVAGFLFELSDEDNQVLNPLVEIISTIIKPGTNTTLKHILSVKDLISPAIGGGVFTYSGSLTTPTCNEVVRWIIYETRISISANQIAAFKTLQDTHHKPLIDNFRPVQPLNGRVVQYLQQENLS